MRRLALVVVLAMGATACAVADEPIALDDTYDVAVGQVARLRVLDNDYLPEGARELEIVDGPAWAAVDGDEIRAEVPVEPDDHVLRYRLTVGDLSAEAAVLLRSVEVQASLEARDEAVPAGDRHTVVARVTQRVGGGAWEPLAGVEVTARISAGSPSWVAGPSCPTGADGRCSLALEAGGPGTATVEIGTIADAGGAVVDIQPRPAATVAWVDARLRLSGNEVVMIDSPATVEAILEVHDGTGWAPAANGEVDVAPAPGSPGLPGARRRCDLSERRDCAVELISPTPLLVHLAAAGRATVAGVPLERRIDGTALPDGSVAWVQALVELGPDVEARAGGQPATVAVTVRAHDGDGERPVGDVDVDVTIVTDAASRDPGASIVGERCTTDPAGRCEVRVAATGPGRIHLRAAASVDVAGAAVRASADGAADATGSVTWLQARLRLSGDQRVLVGEAASITAAVTLDDGVGSPREVPASVTFGVASASNDARIVGSSRCSARCAASVTAGDPGRGHVEATARLDVGGERVVLSADGADDDRGSVTWERVAVTLEGGGTAEAGRSVEFTAQATRDDGSGDPRPAAGVDVEFSLGGTGSLDDAACSTGDDGTCTVTATAGEPGTAAVSIATATWQGRDVPVTAATREARWVDATITITPTVRGVGVFTLTATLTAHDGDAAFGVEGAQITFGGVDPYEDDNTCVTGAEGSCTVAVLHGSAGTVAVTADAATSVRGVTVPASGTVDVTVIAGAVALQAEPCENQVPVFGCLRGATQRVTATVSPLPDAPTTVRFTWDGGSDSCRTVGGTCGVGIVGYNTTHTLRVTATTGRFEHGTAELSAAGEIDLVWVDFESPSTTFVED